MTTPQRLLALFLIPSICPAAVAPGSLVESQFPKFSAQAFVSATAVAGDGSVFVAGGFSAVDGVARPGLAKLSPEGTLDSTFAGTLLEATGFAWVGYQEPEEVYPSLFALPQGRLMQLGNQTWTLHQANGSPDESRLTEFPRSGAPAPRPLFVTAGRVYLIGGEPSAIRAYHTADLFPDTSFQMQAGPRPAWQAVPAADGKLWVLGRTPPVANNAYPPANAEFTLFRLKADGAVDATFAARNLAADHGYTLTAAPDGGFRLTSEWLSRYLYWPVATSRSLAVQRCDATGAEVTNFAYSLPFSWSSREVMFQAPDLAIYPNANSTRLARSQMGTYLPDPAFSITLAAPESAVLGSLDVRMLDAFPDGKLLVGGTRRMLADGTSDPTWHIPRLEGKPMVSRLTKLAGGKLLALGNFDRADGQPAPGIVRILPDDSLDPSFTPTHDFRFALKILPFPDGTLLARFSVPVVQSGAQSQLARFSANGELLSLWPIPEPSGTATFYSGQVTDFAIQSDGTTLITTFQNSEVPTVGFGRIQPDGSSPLTPGYFLNSSVPGALLVLDDDSYLRGNVRFAADGTLLGPIAGISQSEPRIQLADRSVVFVNSSFGGGPRLQKWHPVTGVDAAFSELTIGNASVVAIAAAANDKLFTLDYQGFSRLHATGQMDPTFRPPVAGINEIFGGSGGTVLVAGDFETMDGEPRSGIARLADTRAVDFNEWIAAATARTGLSAADLVPSADPDGDGSSNLLEYAAASDPVSGNPAGGQPRQIANLTWMIPCNPEAPEILRRLETTTDFTNWQPARADQIRLETNRGSLTWTLLPGAPKLFSRVSVE